MLVACSSHGHLRWVQKVPGGLGSICFGRDKGTDRTYVGGRGVKAVSLCPPPLTPIFLLPYSYEAGILENPKVIPHFPKPAV